MQTYQPRNLNTNVRYEKIKLKVDLRRVLNSLPVAPLIESPVLQMPQVLKDALKNQVGDAKMNEKNEFNARSHRKESGGINLPAPKKSIRSFFAETARVKKVIRMFKTKKNS